jgi:hypothetical protein
MTSEELERVKSMVLREVPRVLEQDPAFVVFIEGLISERFPRRDEFARLLEEMESSRQESCERFAQMDRRFDRLEAEVRAGKVEHAEFRRETNQRFTQVDQRLDKVEGRLDKVEDRLGKVEQDLGGLIGEVRGLRHWMELNVGGFQTRAGRRLEDVVAGAFCYGLRRNDIEPQNVRLRQTLEDTQGIVWRPGRKREVDIIAVGQEIIVFEVKSTADQDDIEDLAEKVTLLRHLHPEEHVEGVLVMLGAEKGHRQWCNERGLTLIP